MKYKDVNDKDKTFVLNNATDKSKSDKMGSQVYRQANKVCSDEIGSNVCSKYFEHDKSPVYPERFARRSDISIATSTALFNELKNNNWLDSKKYLKAVSDSISTAMLASPSTYPTYNSLSLLQRDYVNGQLDDMFAAHQFYSDFNKTTIKFMDSQCQ